MKTYIFLICIILSTVNCFGQDNSISLTESMIAKSDSLIKNKILSQIEIFMTISEESIPIKVPSIEDLSNKSYTKLINLIRSKNDRLIAYIEIPVSESGDWNATRSFYYNESGNLLGYRMKANYFEGICSEDVLKETKILFYDSKKELISKTQTVKDKSGNIINEIEKCSFELLDTYPIYFSLEEIPHYSSITRN